MSPSRKPYPAHAGFTLTEVLVAMAIFVTVISGVFALYTGAVETVLRGYNDIDNMAEARSALKVLQDDINTAYTGVEFGDPNQFYGRPEGFMFVGTLASGEIGRVTYVINPLASTVTFASSIVEPYIDTLGRVSLQAEEAGKAAARARGLDDATATAAGRAVADQMLAAFRAVYPPPLNESEQYEFPVIVRTYGVLRYEEAGVRDLENFELRNSGIVWPYIDPAEPLRDTIGGPDATPSDLLYDYLVSALGGPNISNDMRSQALEVFAASNSASSYDNANYAQLHAISPDVMKKIVDTRRRELWIRLLADDPAIVAPHGLDPSASGFLPRFWTNDPNDPDAQRPFQRNYVVTERVLNRAILLDPVSGQPFVFITSTPDTGLVQLFELDALKVPGIFNYGYVKEDFNELTVEKGYINALERMDDAYEDFLNLPSAPNLQALDRTLQNAIAGGADAAEFFGSPVNPRLPGLVQVRFWIADEKVLPNAPDFRRLFTQLIQVPAGASRDITSVRTAQN